MAQNYIRQGLARFTILQELLKKEMFPTVVRESQECVELMLKGLIRYVGIEPTKTHDVSDVLRANRMRFPDWIQHKIEELADISEELAEERGTAFYGDEQRELAPEEIYFKEDAEESIKSAGIVADVCKKLIG